MKRPHYNLLDGLRGIAAIAIVWRHMGAFRFGVPSQTYLAVDLFFLLSGAVIANAYEAKLLAGMTVQRFCALRVARLYPMVAMGVVLGLLNTLYGVRDPTVGNIWIAAAVALIALPDNPFLFFGHINAPAWSLTYEFAANAAYAAGVRWLTMKRLVAICAASAGALVVGGLARGSLDFGYEPSEIAFGVARVGFSFFAGIILYQLHVQGRLRLPRPLRGIYGAALAVGAMVAALVITAPESARAAGALLTDFFVLPAVLVLGLENERAPEWISRRLGDASYPLYLIHWPILMFVRHQVPASFFRLLALIVVPALVSIALAIDRYYDAPSRAFLKRMLDRRSPVLRRAAATSPRRLRAITASWLNSKVWK